MRWKLFKKREAWCLTWHGRAVAVMFTGLLLFLALRFCGTFLIKNAPILAEILIVEGWLPDYALKEAVSEFHRGNYRYVITSGIPLLGGYYVSGAKTSADLAASTLVSLGLKSNLVVAVPAPPVLRGRTFAQAKAVEEWISMNDPKARSVNIFSLGVHSRRSRLVFQEALGLEIKVGCIAHPDAAYEVNRWWRTSEGFKSVAGELLGYIWVRLCGC